MKEPSVPGTNLRQALRPSISRVPMSDVIGSVLEVECGRP
jgi:hypothetical protein